MLRHPFVAFLMLVGGVLMLFPGGVNEVPGQPYVPTRKITQAVLEGTFHIRPLANLLCDFRAWRLSDREGRPRRVASKRSPDGPFESLIVSASARTSGILVQCGPNLFWLTASAGAADHDLVMTIFLDCASRKIYIYPTLLTEGRLPEAFGWRRGCGSRGQARSLHSGDPGLRLGDTTIPPPGAG